MKIISFNFKNPDQHKKEFCLIFSFLSLFIPSVQAVDLVFSESESSIALSEPGGVYANSINLSIGVVTTAADTDFVNSNCNISGTLLVDNLTASATDYRLNSNSFTLTTTPADIANGQPQSQDNFLTILTDNLNEDLETIVVNIRNISITCGSTDINVNNAQVLNISVLDALQGANQVIDSRATLNAIGQATLVSQIEDIRSFSLLSSATRTKNLIRQIHNSRQRTETFDTNNLTVSLNNVLLSCDLFPAYCSNNSENKKRPTKSTVSNSISRLGFFVNGSVGVGERKDRSNGKVDFDSDFFGVGFDYRISNHLILGGALTRSATESGAANRNSKTDYEQIGLSLFSSYYFDSQYYIDFILSSGNNDYDLQRTATLGSLTGLILGDTDGKETSVAFSSGYAFNFDDMELRLSGLLNYTRLTIDSYRETTDSSITVATINQLELEQLFSNIAADFTWNISTNFGVVIPQVSLGWEHQYVDKAFNVKGALSASTIANDFSYRSQSRDNDYFTWLVGVSTILKNGLTAYVNFESYAGRDDIKLTNASFGIRLEF